MFQFLLGHAWKKATAAGNYGGRDLPWRILLHAGEVEC
jgi:hypothetical protein